MNSSFFSRRHWFGFFFKYIFGFRTVYNQITGTTAVREKVRLVQKSPGEAEVTEYLFSYT